MTCKHCKHEFCWLCLEKWSIHGTATGGYYKCNRYEQQNEVNNIAEEEKTKIRLRYYAGRFQSNQQSLQQELKFKNENLDSHIKAIEINSGKVFTLYYQKIDKIIIKESFNELIKTREVLRNSYAYEYYNDKVKEKKLVFEEYLESLQSITEQLSDAIARDFWRFPISVMIELAAKAKRKRIDFLETIENGILPESVITEMRLSEMERNRSHRHHHHHQNPNLIIENIDDLI